MSNIDWKSKLASRKFWVAIVGFVGAVGAIFGLSDGSLQQVTTIIMSGGAMIAYVLGESWVDAKRNQAEAEGVPGLEMVTHTIYPDGTVVDSTAKPALKPPDTEA